MFADDMAFYCHESCPNDLQSKLNADLAAITSWLNDNKLTLNVTKSTFMIIGSNSKLSQFNDIDLMANNSQLEKVTKFKYLGVTINQHLTGMIILIKFKEKSRKGWGFYGELNICFLPMPEKFMSRQWSSQYLNMPVLFGAIRTTKS